MLPTHFEGCNRVYGKPKDWTDEQCGSLDALQFTDPTTGCAVIRTCWMPSKEDIEAITAGRGIILDMYVPVMIPVALFTLNENGAVN